MALRGRIDQPARSRVGRRLRQVSGGSRLATVAAVLDRVLPGVESTYLRTLAANAVANVVRNVWSHSIIFCGHFPDQTYTFSEEEVAEETRGGWYVRQLLGAANIEGSPLFHVLSGNLGYQVEHHLYPDMPSSRYAEIAPKIKDICESYELPYNSGPFSKQLFTVHRTIVRLAFPGGRPRPKPGPYRSPDRAGSPSGASEAARFRGRVPAEHPARRTRTPVQRRGRGAPAPRRRLTATTRLRNELISAVVPLARPGGPSPRDRPNSAADGTRPEDWSPSERSWWR